MKKKIFHAICIFSFLFLIFNFFWPKTEAFNKGYLLYSNGSLYSFFNRKFKESSIFKDFSVRNLYKAVNDPKLKRIYIVSDHNVYIYDYFKSILLTSIHFSSAEDDIEIDVSESGRFFFIAEDKYEDGLIVNVYYANDLQLLKSIKCNSLSKVAFLNDDKIFCVSTSNQGGLYIATYKISDGSMLKVERLNDIYDIDSGKTYAAVIAVNGIIGVVEQLHRSALVENSPKIRSIIIDLNDMNKINVKDMPYGDWYYSSNRKLIIIEKDVFNHSHGLYKTVRNGKVFTFDLDTGFSDEFNLALYNIIGFSYDRDSFFYFNDSNDVFEFDLHGKKIINKYKLDDVKKNNDYQPILWINN